MSTPHESELPPILFPEHLCALLGIAESTLRDARRRPSWPFSEMPRIGRKPRWSREHVLHVVRNGGKKTRG
jgi:hypothetical protein